MLHVSRFTLLLAAVAGMAVFCSWDTAQGQIEFGPRKKVVTQTQTRGWSTLYWSLRSDAKRNELDLTEKQRAKLDEIFKVYNEKQREDYRGIDWSGMSREERTKKYAEVTEQRRKLTEETNQQIKALLTSKQLTTLEETELRDRAAYQLVNPRMAEELGLTEAQQEKLRKNRADYTAAMEKLRRESNQQALDILTAEQLKKLKELDANRYRGFYGRGVGGFNQAPVKRQQ